MYNPATRLLSVLELLQSRGAMNADDLAQALEVETRSVRRYITMLRDIGIPIDGERGPHGGYALRPGFRLPPLMFNAEEITAVMLGLRLTQELGSTASPATESAIAKITRVLPDELRYRAEALRESLALNNIQVGLRPVANERITTISLAIHEAQCLEIGYGAGDGTITQRVIDPYGLVLHARTTYLAAYCHLRQDMRVFRLDRIRTAAPREEHFTPPSDFDATAFVLDSIARVPGTQTFMVRIHAPLAIVRECIPPSLGILEAAGAETMLRCYSDDPHWFARYLSGLELPFMVLETEALRQAVYSLINNLLESVNTPKFPGIGNSPRVPR